MSNFITEYKKGQEGHQMGIPFGPAFDVFSRKLGGTQPGMVYGIVGPPKSGKTTFTDYAFVIAPYLYSLVRDKNLSIQYFSLEVDRISKEFKFACFFLWLDHKIKYVDISPSTINGRSKIELGPNLLRGRLMDDNKNLVKVPAFLEEKLKEVYSKRIVPIFGAYNKKGKKVKSGIVNVITSRQTVAKFANRIVNFASFIGEEKETNEGTTYECDSTVIIIYDHLRKTKGENEKKTIDDVLALMVEYSNKYLFTFVPILHMNRGLTQGMGVFKDRLYPTPDNIKGTGNMTEDCDYLIATFDPNDDAYNLSKHFGLKIRDTDKNLLYPLMRTIHLISSRHVQYPIHYRVNMEGAINNYKKFKI